MVYDGSKAGASSRGSCWPIQAFDVLVTTTAFVLAFSLRTEFVFTEPHWLAMMVGAGVVAVVSLFVYQAVGLFRGTWSQTADADLNVVIKGASLVSMLLICGLVFSEILEQIPRSVPLIHWFITVVALYGSRVLWAKLSRAGIVNPKGKTGQSELALLIGCDQSAVHFLASIQSLAGARLEIYGLLEDNPDGNRIGRTIRGKPVIGSILRLRECLAQLGVHGVFPDRLVVMDSFRQSSPDGFAGLQTITQEANIALDVIDDSYWINEDVEDPPAAGKPRLSVKRYLRWRRPVEWLVAMMLVILSAPLFVILACLCLCDVGRPIFFPQRRPGRYPNTITLMKFRTMRDAFDAEGKLLSDDERISIIGRLIRRSKLDELPQLFSTLKGDMSFIGPRPLLPRDLPETDAHLRAIVRPGVTGWARVNGGHPLEIEEKLALDIWYIQNASLALDVKVLVLTLRTVLFGDRVDRAAIDTAMATRELLRPAAQQLEVAARQPATNAGDQKGPLKPPSSGKRWWHRPVNTLDRAS